MKNVWGWKMGKEKPVLNSSRERKKKHSIGLRTFDFNRVRRCRVLLHIHLPRFVPDFSFFFLFLFRPLFDIYRGKLNKLRARLCENRQLSAVIFPSLLCCSERISLHFFSLYYHYLFSNLFSLSLRPVSPIIRSVDIACAPRERGRRDWWFLTKQK